MMKTLTAALMLGLLAPGVSMAADFGTVQLPPINGMDAFYKAQRESQQAELRRLEIERSRDQMSMRCRLPDGRRVECQ